MKKELNNIEEIEVMNEEEVMETETKQTFGSKCKGAVKKHAKTIKRVIGVVVGGAALAGMYVLGQKSAGGEDYDEFDEDAIDFEDVDFTDVTEE